MQRLEQTLAERSARAAVGVEERAQSRRADTRYIDQVQNAIAVHFLGPGVVLHRAERVPTTRTVLAALEACLHLAALGGAEDAALRTE